MTHSSLGTLGERGVQNKYRKVQRKGVRSKRPLAVSSNLEMILYSSRVFLRPCAEGGGRDEVAPAGKNDHVMRPADKTWLHVVTESATHL